MARYKYDPFGRRIEKEVNGKISRYVYDEENIIAEYDGSGNVKARYTHNLMMDDPLAVEQGGKAYYYHKDGLGSVVELTNSLGMVVKSCRYKSFGERVFLFELGSLHQTYTFTSREYDSESGFYYYRARYYDPKAGRFISRDPIGFQGWDTNLFRYVGNNPVNWSDPLGLFEWANPFTYWGGFFTGAGYFTRNYQDMRDANTIGADKYFHCMANCQAAREGLGARDAAVLISEGRELTDQYLKGDSRSACDADRSANRQGRNGNPNTPCSQACGSLRPNGLDQRY